MESEETEERILGRLRAMILVIIGLGIAAAIVGTPATRWFVPMLYLPVAMVYPRPRWSQILVWIMWSVTWGMLALILAIGGRPALFTAPAHWLLTISVGLLFAGLPLLRWYLTSPRFGASDIPRARIHRRE